MTPEALKPFAMDPRSWESWVPTELLENFVYGSEQEVLIGYNEDPGWFIITRDPEGQESILFCEREVEPTPFVNPAHEPWGKIGRPVEIPSLDGMVCNALLMKSIFRIEGEVLHQPINQMCQIQVLDRVFSFARIHPDLYRVFNINQVPSGPDPRTA